MVLIGDKWIDLKKYANIRKEHLVLSIPLVVEKLPKGKRQLAINKIKGRILELNRLLNIINKSVKNASKREWHTLQNIKEKRTK